MNEKLRLEFAMAALPAVVTIAEATMPKDISSTDAAAHIATLSFEIADAMVAEAEKR